MTQASVAATLRRAQRELDSLEDPRLEASLLLCHVLDWYSSKLFSHSDELLSETQTEQLDALIARRLAGEPSAYLLGERAFWTLDLKVTPDTLIPRPDTETLVEQTLDLIKDIQAPRVLDMGTGSGAIALSIAKERPDAHVEASDFSAAALEVAKENALRNSVSLQAWHCGSWFDALPQNCAPFDLVVSNPPYIVDDDPHLAALKHEPITALISGADGLNDIRQIIAESAKYLRQNGHLALEHGYDQAEAVARLFREHGFNGIQQKRDLGQVIRASAATLTKDLYAQA